MSTCKQQITWHLRKDDLLKLLNEAGSDFSALEVKMCVTDSGLIEFYTTMIQINLDTENCDGIIKHISSEVKICPVPPDCNKNPKEFKDIIEMYLNDGTISFSLNKDKFI